MYSHTVRQQEPGRRLLYRRTVRRRLLYKSLMNHEINDQTAGRAHSFSPHPAKVWVSLLDEGGLSFSIVQEFSGFCKGRNLFRLESESVFRYHNSICKFSAVNAGKGARCFIVMSEFYSIISLMERPDLKDRLADWFHQKWEIPKDAYLESMEECLGGTGPVPQWYAVLDEERKLRLVRTQSYNGITDLVYERR